MSITKISTSNIFGTQKFNRANQANNAVVSTGGFVASYLVQGGGAGGNRGLQNQNYGSGGAAGIQREGNTTFLPATQYTFTVGAGGAGASGGYGSAGLAGGSSSINIIPITATGGNPASGGSRTGGSNADYSGGVGNTSWNGGGGAGAGASTGNRDGGAGRTSTIIDSTVRGGGGGGGGFNAGGNNPGVGGSGGGGAGGEVNSTAGTTNTGSGGGANDNYGSNGGSGIIIIRFPDTKNIAVGVGLTSSSTTSGGFKTVTFTAGAGTVTFS
jgi:hypothetical protein